MMMTAVTALMIAVGLLFGPSHVPDTVLQVLPYFIPHEALWGLDCDCIDEKMET